MDLAFTHEKGMGKKARRSLTGGVGKKLNESLMPGGRTIKKKRRRKGGAGRKVAGGETPHQNFHEKGLIGTLNVLEKGKIEGKGWGLTK